jgi:2,5-furandicarboxylate decarboxylase 1
MEETVSKDLRQFLKSAKEAGPDFYLELKRPLRPKLEKDVLQLKLAREGRFPVIYCPEIEGSKLPVVTNLYGSYELLGLALDMEPKKATKADVFAEYRKRKNKTNPVRMVSKSEAPVKQVILSVKDVNLDLLPIIHHAELDSGKYITIGCMICKDPDTGIPNVGIYRHELKGKDKLGCTTNPAHHGAYIARRYAELGRPMEVAIFVGHHPAVTMGAVSRGNLDMNELELMGGFLGEPMRVTHAETVDLPIPADAEIVIEGRINPNHMVTDGPFAEWLGYYGLRANCYLIEVTGITMRGDAIYQDLAPSQREHNLATTLGSTSAIYDAVKQVIPTVKSVFLPFSGRSLMTSYISIAKRVAGEGMRAGLAAVNCCVDATRTAIVVDEDIDVYNEEEVLWAINTRVVPDDDILTLPRLTGCALVPTSYDEERIKREGTGGPMNTKMVIDATKPVNISFPTQVTPNNELWESMRLEDYLKK